MDDPSLANSNRDRYTDNDEIDEENEVQPNEERTCSIDNLFCGMGLRWGGRRTRKLKYIAKRHNKVRYSKKRRSKRRHGKKNRRTTKK